MIRKIVEINEELCNGCEACANACHEGAIEMVNGKAKLIKDDYCDGLGDCLPACPTNAISIVEREANPYDEEAVMAKINGGCEGMCPGSAAHAINVSPSINHVTPIQENRSELRNWPVQIKLAPISAPYYENANLLVAADCSAYAYASFHNDFIKNHITLIGCPKLDSVDYSEKLTAILMNNNIRSIKIVRMEVPCCGGLENAVKKALQNCGRLIQWQVVTINSEGIIIE